MSEFVKISMLSDEDRSKLRDYWDELWGTEVANALTTDFKPGGNKQDVKASTKKTVKSN